MATFFNPGKVLFRKFVWIIGPLLGYIVGKVQNLEITELKKEIKNISRSELENLIFELYRKNKESKELIESKFNPQFEKVAFKKYKKTIISEFFPTTGFSKLRYSVMNKALKNFKAISNNHELIADLMLTYVETGVEFTNEYGDIDEKFYDTIANMYAKTLQYISRYDLTLKFRLRCQDILLNTEGMGWGFHDELGDLFYKYYKE